MVDENEKLQEQWGDELAKILALESFKLINAQEKIYGPAFVETVQMSLIASFVCALVITSLNEQNPGVSNAQMEKIVESKFLNTKGLIANAVAAGFQGAMQTFTGRPCEYYCNVGAASEPVTPQSH